MRNADPSEIDALVELWYQGWQDAHAGLVPEELAKHRTRANFRERMLRQLADLRVAGEPGHPRGFYTLKGDELDQFYVAAAARGTGLAGAMIADAESRLRSGGTRRAWLSCAIGNERAARFYSRNGWSLARTQVIRLPLPTGETFELEVWRYEKSL